MTATTKDTKEGSTQLDIRLTELTTQKGPFIKNPIKALETLKEITVTVTMTDIAVTPQPKRVRFSDYIQGTNQNNQPQARGSQENIDKVTTYNTSQMLGVRPKIEPTQPAFKNNRGQKRQLGFEDVQIPTSSFQGGNIDGTANHVPTLEKCGFKPMQNINEN